MHARMPWVRNGTAGYVCHSKTLMVCLVTFIVPARPFLKLWKYDNLPVDNMAFGQKRPGTYDQGLQTKTCIKLLCLDVAVGNVGPYSSTFNLHLCICSCAEDSGLLTDLLNVYNLNFAFLLRRYASLVGGWSKKGQAGRQDNHAMCQS